MAHLQAESDESSRGMLMVEESQARVVNSMVVHLEDQVMAHWGTMTGELLRSGKLQAPRLTAMIQQYQGQTAEPEAPSAAAQFVAFVVNLLIFALGAYIYKLFRKVPEGMYKVARDSEYEENWKHACWTCYEEPGTTLCGCCCLPVRWAETVSFVKGLLSFWTAFFFLATIIALQRFLWFAALGQVIFIIVGVKYRQDLRKSFNFKSQGGVSYVTDCCLYLCCAPCAVIQEARHVEDALAANHEATACPEGRQRSSRRSQCWTSRMFQEGNEYREYNW